MTYIGVMSGTSCDGIDVIMVNFALGFSPQASQYFPYPDAIKKKLGALINDEPVSVSALTTLDAELGHLYAQAINALLKQHNTDNSQVEAIGLHGQTICHQPDGPVANTMQLGSAAIVATQTGITTVANFRQMDVACGGQGAPLAPVIHQQLFSQPGKHVVVLNLGGIANITCLQDEGVIGFDTGPANCLLDGWVQSHRGVPYDKAGDWAKQGRVNQRLLQALLAEPYFQQPYPKSTGRELFNERWLAEHLVDSQISTVDVQRTLLQLTVASVQMGIMQTGQAVDQVVVCGGGAHNDFMLALLADVLAVPVTSSEHLGLHPDYVEAVLMAWLACQNRRNIPLNLNAITGATKPLVYGVSYTAK